LLAIAASSAVPHALLWPTVGTPPDRDDVRLVVGLLTAARAVTREIRAVFIFRPAIGEFRFLRRIC
jgi:hypothetical protein